MQNLDQYITTHFDRFTQELAKLIQIPSIGADPQYTGAMMVCAHWLKQGLKNVGFPVIEELFNGGKPLIFAERTIDPAYPTILIYGHYDVQPVEAENQWRRAPFSAELAEGYIWGRGACDNKGQFFAHLKALEYLFLYYPQLPLNVKVILDSEEEMGSSGLCQLIAQKPALFQADLALVSDSLMPAENQPVLHHALRGNLSAELQVFGRNQTVHSGNFGGIVQNPLEVLGWMLGRLHDRFGRIAIPDLYQQVKNLTQEERMFMLTQGWDEVQMLQAANLPKAWGEVAYTPYERTSIRPALTITGITGGYTGPGIKSIIPNWAQAKLNLRLVPHQEPKYVSNNLRQFFAAQLPSSMHLKFKAQALVKAYEISPNHPLLKLAADTLCEEFGRLPKLLRSGGTIPPVSSLAEHYGMPIVLAGFGLPGDNIHAPNERFKLTNFKHAIRFSTRFLQRLSQYYHDHRLPLSCR